MKSLVTDIHGMKSPAQFPGILTDEIITCGAPTKLISDSTHVETCKEVPGILCTYGISSWQSEPHQQHQNPAVKQLCNTILDQTSAPAYCWLWQDLHDDDKTCMQLSYWELILENGQ
jgi:hypothetical protein